MRRRPASGAEIDVITSFQRIEDELRLELCDSELSEVSMGYEAGRIVWIPCEAKPGPFSDERIVRIVSERGEWVGFVNISALRDPVMEGSTFVRAVIVNVEGSRFNAKVAGEACDFIVVRGNAEQGPAICCCPSLTSSQVLWESSYTETVSTP